MFEKIETIVESSLNEILLLQTGIDFPTNAKEMTIYGNNGVLDSISLVSLILLIEEKLQDAFNFDILLANEKAMSQINSPFNNYNALTQFIHTLLEEKNMQKPITLISGTRKGIGKGLVEYYTSQGHTVIGFSRTDITWTCENYTHFQGDVTDETFIIKLLNTIKLNYGRLDNLINNAAIAAMNHSLITPKYTVEAIFNTNVLGTFLLCREAAKLMKKNNYGRIVNFSTVAVPLRLDGESIYAASKSAVGMLTQILAKEFAPFGITLNAIGPTPIKTDLIKSVPPHKIEKIISNQAIKRMGELADITNVIDFFLSAQSHFITGQKIYLGGVS